MADNPQFPDDPGLWKVLTREYVAREPWYTVRVDRVQLPSGTIIPKYWISEYPPWVNVVAVTADERVVLIRQYRHGIGGAPRAAGGDRLQRRHLVSLDDAVGEPRPPEQPDLYLPGRGRDRGARIA